MNSNKETILKYIQTLEKQIKIKDSEILRLKKEKQDLIEIFNKDYKPYKKAIIVLFVIVAIESGIIGFSLLM